jgi:hypothetical protein
MFWKKIVRYIISFIIALVLKLVSGFYKVVIAGINEERIGHLALEPELISANIKNKTRHNVWFYFMSGEKGKVANVYLKSQLEKKLNIGPAWLLGTILSIFTKLPFLRYYDPNVFINLQDCRTLDKSTPIIELSQAEICDGEKLLNNLGIPKGSPFICLSVRDNAFLLNEFPDYDFSYHDYRDSKIENYLPMCEYFAQEGYYVLRTGKVQKTHLKSTNPKIIDYSFSEYRTDFGDVYLYRNCTFAISTSTGIDRLALIFRKPLAIVNANSSAAVEPASRMW